MVIWSIYKCGYFTEVKLSINYQGRCHFLAENKCFILCNFLIIKERTEKESNISIYHRVVEWGKGPFNDRFLKIS